MGHRYLPATKKMTSNMYFLKASILQSMSMIEKVPLWKKIIKTKKNVSQRVDDSLGSFYEQAV